MLNRNVRLQANQSKDKGSIPTLSAIIIMFFVGVLSFAAGARAQMYGYINPDRFSSNESEGTLPEDLDYADVESVYDRLKKKYDGELTEQQVLDGLKKGLAEATGDDYTVYLSPEEAEEFNNELNGTFTGIGAEIGMEDDVITVVTPLRGFPAEAAGLRAGDAILKIDDEDTAGMTVNEAVSLIRGEKGTDVTLTVARDGKVKEIKITRDEINVPSVEWEINSDNIGVITMSRFSDDTTKLAEQAAQEFKEAGVKGVVLDLRNNGGGVLNVAVDVAGLWLENKVVVEEREDSGEVITDSLESDSGAPLQGIPTVVLINQGSASASEIVAGALNDYDVATLVGETSFGKGSVQSLEEFNDGGVLKVTIARWYTPEGSNIDKDGIAPDVKVEMTDKDFEAKRDPQMDKALEQLR